MIFSKAWDNMFFGNPPAPLVWAKNPKRCPNPTILLVLLSNTPMDKKML